MRRLLLGAALLVGGCQVAHPPVPVVGSDLSLDGVWEGTYESRDTGRMGDLTFALDVEADSAVGEVVMVPRGTPVSVRRDDNEAWRWEGVARPQILTIRFVRLGDGRVSGELNPYQDPDCGCTLRTVFEGTVDGDRANGTFTSEAAEDAYHSAEGTWTAVRRVDSG